MVVGARCIFRRGTSPTWGLCGGFSEGAVAISFVFEERTVTSAPCSSNNSVRVPRAYDIQCIHAQTIIPFVF